MPIRVLMALSAALAVLAASGCGSSGHKKHAAPVVTQPGTRLAPRPGHGTVSPVQLSTGAFQRRINAVCARYAARTKALPKPRSITDVAAYTTKGRAIVTQELGELKGVDGVPARYRTQFHRALALLGRTEASLGQIIAAAKARDSARLQAIAQSADLLDQQANALAASIGLTSCGEE